MKTICTIKKLIAISLFFLMSLNSNSLFCQILSVPETSNFFEYLEHFTESKRYSDLDTTEGGSKAQVERLLSYWGSRLHPHGDFSIANNAIIDYALNYNHVNSTVNPNWTCVGPSNTPSNNQNRGVGQIHRISFDPFYGISNNTVYASTGYGGLWRSQDNGENWENVNTDLLPIASVSDVAICPTNNQVLFISTGNPDGGVELAYGPNWSNINPVFTIGIYRSIDYGNTWHTINNGLLDEFITNGGTIRKIEVDKLNPNILVAATSNGIYMTSNALATTPIWTNVFSGLTGSDKDFRVVKFKPSSSNTLYASSNNIFRSNDGGATWNSMTGPGTGLDFSTLSPFEPFRINLAVTPANNNRLFAYIWGVKNGSSTIYIYYYENNNWNQLYTLTAGHLAKEWLGFAVSPVNPNEYYFYGFMGVYGSKNLSSPSKKGGYISNGTYADGHVLEFQPNTTSNPLLFFGHHGGISVGDMSPSGYGLWQKKNNGLANLLLWSFDDSEFFKDVIVTAKQDHYVDIYIDGEWKAISGGGDSYSVKTSKTNNSLFFGSAGDDHLSRHQITSISNTYESNLRPFDAAFPSFRTHISKSFQLKNPPNTNYDYFSFSEIYKRKKHIPATGDTHSDMWEISSDVGKFGNAPWQRQLTEFDFCYTQPNTQYTANGAVFLGEDGYWFTPFLAKTTIGGVNGNYNQIDAYEMVTFPGSGDTHPIISGIAVHPNNPDSLWVSMIGYDNIDTRVAFSSDGGVTWSNADPNNSLPKLPVNNIVYQYGSNDVVYIGTDVGVFYKTPDMANWERYGDLPHVRVMELKINYCQQKLRVATFGRSVWEADLLPFTEPVLFEIKSGENITWEFDKALHTSLKIKEGGKLTIKAFVSMPANSVVIVEQGGELVLDGGIITNKCEQPWQGIQVWGNKNASQHALPGQPNPQGKLTLLNGATIEHAYNAVTLWKPNDWNTTGGIILADSANFLNNHRSVEFISYQNTNPVNGTPMGNASYFRNCHFEVNDDYIIEDSPFNCHISMFNVDGINLTANSFLNQMTEGGNSGAGIISIDANYRVVAGCNSFVAPCPPADFITNHFEGFAFGIDASNSSSFTKTIYVRQAEFVNNGYGIRLNALNNATIIQNNFSVGTYGKGDWMCGTDFGIGIELAGCNTYAVEENTFTPVSPLSTIPFMGIRVLNNDEENVERNEIYFNTFDQMNRANQADGINYIVGYPQLGLNYRCNQNTNNYFDFVVTDQGIAGHQTSLQYAADNTFTAIAQQPTDPRHFFNDAVNPITYHYRPGLANAQPLYVYNVTSTPLGTVPPGPCTSNYGGGNAEVDPDGLTAAQKQYFEQELTDSHTAYTGVKSLYASLLDGGNTDAVQSEIAMAWPEDMWELRAELLGLSPLLSKDVLVSASDRTDVLPESIIFEVLSANPDELKKKELMEHLETKDNPLPEYMIEILESLTDNVTYKTILQSQMAHYGRVEGRATGILLRDMLRDSTTTTESIRTFMAERQSLPMDMQRVDSYLESGETAQALALAASLPQQYTLDGEALAEHGRFVQLKQLQTGLHNQGRNIFQLTPTEKEQLEELIEQSSGTAGRQARSILAFVYEEEFCDCPADINPELKASTFVQPPLSKLDEPQIIVRPNPAKTWVSFDYTVPGGSNNAMLEIRDAGGKLVYHTTLENKQGQHVWDTRNIAPGLYHYTLKTTHGIKTGKVTIIK